MASSIPVTKRSKVVQGTCGWTGQQLAAWQGKAESSKSSPLAMYARHFPSVEINSSNYAIPTENTVEKWVTCVGSGEFRFTFKAFGLFTNKSVDPKALPGTVKDRMSDAQRACATVTWDALKGNGALDVAWQAYNDALLVAYRASTSKVPHVVAMFQFPLSFGPSQTNLRHVLECRRRLDYRIAMAVEFRDRNWFVGDAKNDLQLLKRLRDRGIGIVHADELHHETFPNAKNAQGDEKLVRKVLPICMDVTSNEFAYVRIHRRTGFEDRRLSAAEIGRWRDRIRDIAAKLDDGATIFVFWGTEHANEPLINKENLRCALKELQSVEVVEPKKVVDKGLRRFFPFMGITSSNT